MTCAPPALTPELLGEIATAIRDSALASLSQVQLPPGIVAADVAKAIGGNSAMRVGLVLSAHGLCTEDE